MARRDPGDSPAAGQDRPETKRRAGVAPSVAAATLSAVARSLQADADALAREVDDLPALLDDDFRTAAPAPPAPPEGASPAAEQAPPPPPAPPAPPKPAAKLSGTAPVRRGPGARGRLLLAAAGGGPGGGVSGSVPLSAPATRYGPEGPGRAPKPGKARKGPPKAKATRRGRKAMAGVLITMAIALILGAVGVGGYPFWTDVQAARHQKALKARFAQEQTSQGDDRLKLLQEYQSGQFADATALTEIIIPAIHVDSIVVQGTSEAALNVGAGHYPQTPLPGAAGNVAIAGHRTMNGHPFGDLDKLAPGDTVELKTPFDIYTYTLIPPFGGHQNPWVTTPDDWSVVSVPTQDKLLTLTTCNPKGQQTQRLVARAVLTSTQAVA